MDAEDPLKDLADIHLPDAVSLWPPAPGWWLLAALVLAGLVWLGRHMLARLHRQRRLQRAINALDSIYRTWQQANQNQQDAAARNQAGLDLLYGFNAVLKRAALVTYSAGEIPRMTGTPWLQFLDRIAGGDAFTNGTGRVLGDGIYRPVLDADIEGLFALCKRWIRLGYLRPEAAKPKAVPAATVSRGAQT